MSATTPTRRRRSAPEVRAEEIVCAARALFVERGIAKTSTTDVAERAGVARGLVYYYFADKDALVDAVLDEYVEEFTAAVRAWDAAREVGDIDTALVDCVAMFRTYLRAIDPLRDDLRRPENGGLYDRFLDRAVRAVVASLEATTVEAYAARHHVRITHVAETFYVLVYGLVGLVRNSPDVDDAVLATIVRQTLHLDEESSSDG
ncbi:TetR/AcrR family transcriptional regulator [Cellulosimicrobium cellulans]|uniref:TetR/AcrR family transcriptional regulator n=1 Tax=Cellulosimicrobium cellulans TaxID=1710 RepID=UPI0020CBBB30|nr:TetR/AcrR family transcriptional regulator [Cellulosimicrobium cellulans]